MIAAGPGEIQINAGLPIKCTGSPPSFFSTDSEFVQIFIERGEAVLAFGPQLPMGNTYDRDRLLGAAESTKVPRREIVVKNAKGGRVRAGPSRAGRSPAGRPTAHSPSPSRPRGSVCWEYRSG